MEKDPKVLMKCVFGSYLYGTNTASSDRDYKAIYLPNIDDLILGHTSKSSIIQTKQGSGKNSAEDVDFESCSLQRFILHLGKNGDTMFLDMLHAPDSALIQTSDQWEFIRKHRTRFYTKMSKSYIGYARKHSQHFVSSTQKRQAVEDLLVLLKEVPPTTKLADVYDSLPDTAFSRKYKITNSEHQDQRTYDFCGKKFMASSNVGFAIESLERTYSQYGQRTKDAAQNDGINFKSLSHAFRVGFQLQQLYSENDMTFPLAEAEWLRDMKMGKLNFVDDKLSAKLQALLENVDHLAEASKFPECVEMTFWEDWILSLYKTSTKGVGS